MKLMPTMQRQNPAPSIGLQKRYEATYEPINCGVICHKSRENIPVIYS